MFSTKLNNRPLLFTMAALSVSALNLAGIVKQKYESDAQRAKLDSITKRHTQEVDPMRATPVNQRLRS